MPKVLHRIIPIAVICGFNIACANAEDEFIAHLMKLYNGSEYGAIVHESQRYVHSLPQEQVNDRMRSTSNSVRDILFDTLYRLDSESDLHTKCLEVLGALCIWRFECSLETTLTLARLSSPLSSIEMLIGIGLYEDACELMHTLTSYIDDDMNVEKYLSNNTNNHSYTEAQIILMAVDMRNLFFLSILPVFCDLMGRHEKRNDEIVALLFPHREAPWMPRVIEEISSSAIWGNVRMLPPSRQLKEYYSFLCAVEPITREHTSDNLWIDLFYTQIIRVADKLEEYNDLVKWWNVRLALATTPGRASEARQELSQAQRKLREQQGAPHPHEEDIKMMEELGLFE